MKREKRKWVIKWKNLRINVDGKRNGERKRKRKTEKEREREREREKNK